MWQEIEYSKARGRGDVVWIDVRSGAEYEESTIPGAVHIPIFDDEERAQIGTVYKTSPRDATDLGLAIASRKFPELVARIEQVAGDRLPIVFCWRGGMRSKAVATIVDLAGRSCARLTGGYRAYRQYVTARLDHFRAEDLPPAVVLHGMTGVGKTMLLSRLAARGAPVLDLEQLARHRGSVFGGIGLEPANQRQFDSGLLDELDRLAAAPFMLMEAESKRIGRATMPDFLFAAKLRGLNIELTATLPVRVERTLRQYGLEDEDAFHAAMANAVGRIERRFSPDLRKRSAEWLARRDFASLVFALLEEYYDPRYRHAMATYERSFTRISAEDLDTACEAVLKLCPAAGLAQ